MEEGAQVVIADLDAERGEELAAELGDAAAFKQTDVGDADQVQALVDFTVERFGGLHVMCNNAGIGGPRRRFLDDELSDFDALMRVNVFGVMVGCQRAARHMAEHGGGSIINTTSIGGINAGGGLMTYRAVEGRGHPPHPVHRDRRRRTRHPGELRRAGPHPDRDQHAPTTRATIVRLMQPLQRVGSPADVANAVAVPGQRPVGAGHRDRAAGRRRDDRRAGPMVKLEDVAARPDANAK